MTSSQHVEMEAAMLLQKLIQESTDEPVKLAAKLFTILQHMKSSGKEQSLPYQVISRAMETVITQHGLDIHSLKSSHLPLAGGTQVGDSGQKNKGAPDNLSGPIDMPIDGGPPGMWSGASSSKNQEDNYGSSSHRVGVVKEPNRASVPKDVPKQEAISSCGQASGPCVSASAGDRFHPRSIPATGIKIFKQETEEPRSANLQEVNDATILDKQKHQNDNKEVGAKSVNGDSSLESGGHGKSEINYQDSSKLKLEALRRDIRVDSSTHTELNPHRSAMPNDMGKIPTSQAFASSDRPFKEHQLRQLRAQCLVHLAFRNHLVPRKLHLEIALGDSNPKDGGDADGNHGLNAHSRALPLKEPFNQEMTSVSARLNDTLKNEKEMSLTRISPGSSSTASMMETDVSSKDAESTKKTKNKKGPQSNRSVMPEEKKRVSAVKRKPEVEKQTRETAELQMLMMESDSPMNSGRTSSEGQSDKKDSSHDAFKGTSVPVFIDREHVAGKVDNPYAQLQIKDIDGVGRSCKGESPTLQTNASADNYASSLLVKEKIMPITPVAGKDVKFANLNLVGPADSNPATSKSVISNSFTDNCVVGVSGPDCQIKKQYNTDGLRTFNFNDSVTYGNSVSVACKYTEQEEENKSDSNDMLVSAPKYTTSEKWIMDHCERKVLEEQNWALKQRKAEERIAVCFDRLKENVSSSGDISAKTKSVIELKKLQLLKLQRRLRSDFLNDFFKPITSNMERLKSIKKHRHGRRIKQLERFEQKMKEERQKRICERQKEFFSEIEAHKERLEDFFKIKRERCKGFHKYVKEFHKRKERIHREKIDRIQREKILLLKSNDVEGYLRMVQDTKSDRVKQLLKETEKYLQKLSSKLKEAKATTRSSELEMDDSRAVTVEKNEFSVENDDESDQAQHYLESNEKYYLLAHSIKETINEQPATLQGGKLREYQMNGLRWLVSLHNNHLNGILADEMGLGKTVQVISLICYLMEVKNCMGPFLVVVPSSVLPGWENEISFWAPSINSITYTGPPEARRRLFKERIAQQKFNVLLTTYEYLMNKNDRPRLSKLHWHYVIIDEGHRIKNASCKLNADLKHFQSSHRLLLTGTPLQNNLEELWALLNFLLPNIFNSSEDFSQWFNKPFESSGDNSPDEALLSEEENLLIINRLHQVLRPFVLRRLKHKVANELPEKIERLIRCEASAYQKLLMKRVEDNLGCLGSSKGRTVHNSVMELRNICNHPYLSQLHADEVNSFIPKHYLPSIVRLCGKLEVLDRLLPKLKSTDHRVLLFSTMTRLLDIMEEYLSWKGYKYLRLDGHTSGYERGALIEEFNRPESQAFIFLLSLRAGGVGVNLQAADTVIIFDTDWNPQVDLQAQARAHRLGQKKDVLVLRLETVRTVEEQVRAAAEHKLGVANQSITAGFFDNNTSAEDRREYLESLLRECKKEETASVLDDDALNDLIARSGSEIDVFESIDKKRREDEMALWQRLQVQNKDAFEPVPAPPMPPRLVTDEDLKAFYRAMEIYEASNAGVKRKGDLGDLDTQHYGRGKRAREVRSYEDQWTEEEFEKLCQVDSPESSETKETQKHLCPKKEACEQAIEGKDMLVLPSKELPLVPSNESLLSSNEPPLPSKELTPPQSKEQLQQSKEVALELPPPSKEQLQQAKEEPLELPPPSREPLQLSKQVPPQLKEAQQSSRDSALPTKEPQPSGSEQPLPAKRGRGRPKRVATDVTLPRRVPSMSSGTVNKQELGHQRENLPSSVTTLGSDSSIHIKGSQHQLGVGTVPGQLTPAGPSIHSQVTGQSQKIQSGSNKPRKRSKKQNSDSTATNPEVNSNSMVPMQIDLTTERTSTFAFPQPIERLIRPSGTSNATPVNFELNQISRIPNVVFLVPVITPTTSIAPVSQAQAAAFEAQSASNTSKDLKKSSSANICVNRAGQQLKINQASTVTSSLAKDLLERRTLRAGQSDMTSDEKHKHIEKLQLSSDQTPQKAGLGCDASTTEPPNDASKPIEAVTCQDQVQPNNTVDKNSHEVKNETRSVAVTLPQKKSPAEESRMKASNKRGSKRKGSVSTIETRTKNTRSISAAASAIGHSVSESKNPSYSKSSNVAVTTDKEEIAGKQNTVTPEQSCNLGDQGHKIHQFDTSSSEKPNSCISIPSSDSCPSKTVIVEKPSNECSIGSKDVSGCATDEKSEVLVEGAAVHHSPEQHLKSVTPVFSKETPPTVNPTSEKQDGQSVRENTTGTPSEISEPQASGDVSPSAKVFSNKVSSVEESGGKVDSVEKLASSDVVITKANDYCPVVSNVLLDRSHVTPETTRPEPVGNLESVSDDRFTEIQYAETADNCSPSDVVSQISKKEEDGVADHSQSDARSNPANVMLVPVSIQSTVPVEHVTGPFHTNGSVISTEVPVNPGKDDFVEVISKENQPVEVGLSEGAELTHGGSNIAVSYQETKLDQHAFEGTIPVDISKVAVDCVAPPDANILSVPPMAITSSQNIQDNVLPETTCTVSEDKISVVSEAVQSVAAESCCATADPMLEDCHEPQVAEAADEICTVDHLKETVPLETKESVEMVEDVCLNSGAPNMHNTDIIDSKTINQDHVEEIKAPIENLDPSTCSSRDEKLDSVSNASIVGTESNDVMNISKVCAGDKDSSAENSDLSKCPSLREEDKNAVEMSEKDSMAGTAKSNGMVTPGDGAEEGRELQSVNVDSSSSPSRPEEGEKAGDKQ